MSNKQCSVFFFQFTHTVAFFPRFEQMSLAILRSRCSRNSSSDGTVLARRARPDSPTCDVIEAGRQRVIVGATGDRKQHFAALEFGDQGGTSLHQNMLGHADVSFATKIRDMLTDQSFAAIEPHAPRRF
jgi:hypothetical protein